MVTFYRKPGTMIPSSMPSLLYRKTCRYDSVAAEGFRSKATKVIMTSKIFDVDIIHVHSKILCILFQSYASEFDTKQTGVNVDAVHVIIFEREV